MFIMYAISRLPFSILYTLSDCIFFLIYYVVKYRKKVVFSNLQHAFPEKSVGEIKRIAKEFYLNLTDVIVETVKALTITPEELIKRVSIQDIEALTKYLDKKQSLIVMASHQANWEWLQLVHAAKLDCEVDAVYKPLRNPFFERLMLTIRTRFNSYPLPMQKLPREIINRKEITRIIAMVADQTPAPEQAIWIDFLNQDTPFFTGAAKIAHRTKYPILYAGMRRMQRGYYQVYFTEIANPLAARINTEQIIQDYVKEVEKSIKLSPPEWLWSHKRWKHKRPVVEGKEPGI